MTGRKIEFRASDLVRIPLGLFIMYWGGVEFYNSVIGCAESGREGIFFLVLASLAMCILMPFGAVLAFGWLGRTGTGEQEEFSVSSIDVSSGRAGADRREGPRIER